MKLLPAVSTLALLLGAACSSTPPAGSGSGTGGTAAGGTGASQAGTSAVAGAMQGGTGTGGTAAGGSSGAEGVSGSGGASAGSGGSSGSGSGAGSGGSGAGGSGGASGGAGGSAGSSGVPAGCTADPHPICIDFESGIDKNQWTGGTDGAVSMQDKAHGMYSYHAYPNAGVLKTTKFNGITNVLWGRFYLRMTPGNKSSADPVPAGTPGAPGGHGNIVGAYQGGDWYELGWQFNGLMGVWHYAGGENPLRSHPTIMDQWYCVELLFDGTKMEMPQWYVDGQAVETYMGEPNNQKPHTITQFDTLTVGFTAYAGLGIAVDPYGNNNDPVLTDMWLDDIAFDTKRIGCIAN